jgi:hypothetical protein
VRETGPAFKVIAVLASAESQEVMASRGTTSLAPTDQEVVEPDMSAAPSLERARLVREPESSAGPPFRVVSAPETSKAEASSVALSPPSEPFHYYVDGLNAMLEEGQLSPSLSQGTVRLNPKIKGLPSASQLWPITLLNTDYKILTKVYVARLMQVLPSILQKAQLCSIKGRNTMQGAVALWTTVECVRQSKRKAFFLNLDFYHAYDRTSLAYVDRVLAATGFGDIFRGVVATLYKGATASFLLHCVTPAESITFSIRQGDPMAMLLYNIQLKPFLLRLDDVLPGVAFPDFEEREEAYVNDMVALGEDEEDLHI